MNRASHLDELTERARRRLASQTTRDGADGAGASGQAGAASRQPEATGREDGTSDSGAVAGGEIILGIDPGTATTGYGFVRRREANEELFESVAYGVIETPAEMEMSQRLLVLYRQLAHLIATYHPSGAAVEKLFFGRNTTTAITVGQARGVALLALAEAGVPLAEYSPMEIKHALAGFGRAQKGQMQRMVQMLLELPVLPRPDDAADGLAIAICHLRLERTRAMGLR